LKELTRGKSKVTQEDIASFIETLQLSEPVKKELKAISPANYTGMDLLNSEIA
jgi:adenylosuccinate lyase